MSENKYCRICWEDGGVLTSIFTTDFPIMPSEMVMLCAKVKIYKNDGMPGVICNNCLYRLGVAYHFKQQCEDSEIRLRQYYGLLDRAYGTKDAEVNTDDLLAPKKKFSKEPLFSNDEDEESSESKRKTKYKTKTKRCKRKPPEERKKRGPKPTPKEPQTCFECNKTFKCAALLQMHIRCHSGERPFSCNFCPRRFAQKHNLTTHLRIHTGEKPFQCEICSKQFSALGNFQQHKKIHLGIRDQICPVCNKAFLSSGDLSRHIAIHSGIKNHHCETCGKSFTRNRDMLTHKKKMHLTDRGESVETTSPPPPVTNQPGTIDHLLNSTPIHPAPISSSLPHVIPGMIPSQSHVHLGMMHQRIHPY